MKKIVFLFWDQLSLNISALEGVDKDTLVVLVECMDECTYVRHHKKKLVYLLAAQRHFKEALEKQGYNVSYYSLYKTGHKPTIPEVLPQAIKTHHAQELVVTHPGEYRQLQLIKKIANEAGVKLTLREDTCFVCSLKAFSDWAQKQKSKYHLVMENFYHNMRRKTGLLMNKGKPEGGKWNYDHQNRNPLETDEAIPAPKVFALDKITRDVQKLVAQRFADHFGDIEPFNIAVTRRGALQALDYFVEKLLPQFGPYQDAMLQKEPFLFHSTLSHYLNNGLLEPIEVCEAVEQAYYAGHVALASAEGFIRQVIGWREFVRGLYWHFMPGYANSNALGYKTPLPWFYWSGDTKMNCVRHVVKHTKEHAYSHHIQRLMITGNFAALIGVRPQEIHEWYLVVYIDAFEWVEMPNTIGMATYADGGIMGTKPYISGGNYINKMSDFCKNCHYSVTKKTGEGACPFNYLYWNYLIKHEDKLKANHRLGMPYKTLEKMNREKKEQIQKDARTFIASLKAMPDG